MKAVSTSDNECVDQAKSLMSEKSIKKTKDFFQAKGASKDESVVEATNVKVKKCIDGSKSKVDGRSPSIIEEPVLTSDDSLLYSAYPPDPGSLLCLSDLTETRPGPRRKRRIKLVKGS